MNNINDFFEVIKNELGTAPQEYSYLLGGWRKKVFKINLGGKELVACFWPKKAISLKRILQSLKLEENVCDKGIIGGRKVFIWPKLVKCQGSEYWLAFLKYLSGERKDHWGERESFELGKISAQLHLVGICHFDLKPGNILWGKDGKVVGVIDFEEAKLGKKYFSEDLANTTSWILASGGSREAFLEGYKQGGLMVDYDKINQHLGKFSKMRQIDQSFLLSAKQELEVYQQRIRSKILRMEELADFRRKNKDKRIVLVVGAFELIHYGHILFLMAAKKLAKLLVVGVASDESRRRLKGELHPLISAKTRQETLAYFEIVDGVVIVDEDNIIEPLKKLKPDILFTSFKDWREGVRKKEEAEIFKEWKGKVVKSRHRGPMVSSSQLVSWVARKKIAHLTRSFSNKKLLQPLLKQETKDQDSKNQLELFLKNK